MSNDLAVPGNNPGRRDVPLAIAFSGFSAIFVELIGQGYTPAEAFTLALIICIGAAEILRRHRENNERPGGPRWA
ncbi:hypothetical protein GT755_38310 [Herbidospora sp. NEAU-GS84]|uniref:Uncharacterized protein n=1 Tax=Herbidospora solisilvae TaxID=2696284 RepID=A0A7C9N696_9ACTN|nr:hypothetical protein [Herbidospora solisilvae]NAS27509.1 hypothetical protein [Herbidospora solisilvae]